MPSRLEPTFNGMPPNVQQKIVNAVKDWKWKWNLWQCSKLLQELVENSSNEYERFSVSVFVDEIFMLYEIVPGYNAEIKFHDPPVGMAQESDYVQRAIQKFEKIMKNPDISLKILEVRLIQHDPDREEEEEDLTKQEEFLSAISSFLEKRSSKLAVRTFKMISPANENDVMCILKNLVPGQLSEIEFMNGGRNPIRFDEISELDQWKRATKFRAFNYSTDLPFKKWRHFEYFHSGVSFLRRQIVKNIVNLFFKENRELFRLKFQTAETEKIEEYLTEEFEIKKFEKKKFEKEKIEKEKFDKKKKLWIELPGTTDLLTIVFDESIINIQRVPKESKKSKKFRKIRRII